MLKTLYSTKVTVKGGRDGRAVSSDGRFDQKMAMPRELGGPGGEGTNPEQLFAAGYAACFESALRLVAKNQHVAIKDAAVTAEVDIGQTPQGGFGLAVKLHAVLPGIEHAKALELVNAAHQVCPYSNATRNNIDVQLSVE